MKKSLLERVIQRLLRESAAAKLAGLGALVVDAGDRRRAFLYDTNMLIDYLRYGDEFIDNPIDMKPLMDRNETRNVTLNRILKGYIGIIIKNNECHNAAVVAYAVGPGYGKEIYGLGYAMSPNGLLAPDRTVVSAQAQTAWKKAADKGRKRHKFDDKFEPKTPPREDDCIVHEFDHKEHLNYAYEAEGWERGMLQYLTAQHDAAMRELSDLPNIEKEVEKLLYSVSENEFWRKHAWS